MVAHQSLPVTKIIQTAILGRVVIDPTHLIWRYFVREGERNLK